MVIEIEYFKAFSQSVVGVSFDEANELFTKNLTVLSST
jgi:hypothetical protein